LEAESKATELGHDVPVPYFSGPMLVNDGEQIDRIARTAADLPVSEKKLHYLPSLFLFVHVAVFVV